MHICYFIFLLLSAWSLHITVWLYERSDAYSFSRPAFGTHLLGRLIGYDASEYTERWDIASR